ncbi:G-protein coupled receptor 61 [Corythoichthys intestinalis]|uniref:G-protein coupled receptor 61 n=1 Tax=Corythoichthys intestinalis TaxID=161448 RepID=UPI0025A5E54A|nr:G-protein coupled receptor 61 [Corythoichthys intestinalis]XP_061803033.1 G-protein coupled receptor 61-like [Nerophis lumbriciformis]
MEHLITESAYWNTSVPRPPQSNTSGVDVSRSLALCAMLIMDILAVVGNLAMMIVIYKSPHLRKFTFVFHLCLVDLLAALVLMPLGMVPDRLLAVDDALCQSYLCLNVCLVSAAILTICAINVERYYYVMHPMRHEVKMTIGVAAMVLAGIWMKALIMSSLPFLGWLLQGNQDVASSPPHCSLQWEGGRTARLLFMVFSTFIYFLCPMLIILVVYCNMFKVARVAATHHGPLPTWMDAPRQRAESASSQSASLGGTCSRNTHRRTFGSGKVAAILVVVGGQFLCCWLPYFSFHLYLAAVSTSPASLAQLETAVTWIAYFCFTTNPFFYGYLNRQIREEIDRYLAGLFKWARSSQGEQLPSREASIEENFLQFLQGTACNLEPYNSHGGEETEHEGRRESSALRNVPADVRIPGQILEETSEFIQRQILNNQLNTLH